MSFILYQWFKKWLRENESHRFKQWPFLIRTLCSDARKWLEKIIHALCICMCIPLTTSALDLLSHYFLFILFQLWSKIIITLHINSFTSFYLTSNDLIYTWRNTPPMLTDTPFSEIYLPKGSYLNIQHLIYKQYSMSPEETTLNRWANSMMNVACLVYY